MSVQQEPNGSNASHHHQHSASFASITLSPKKKDHTGLRASIDRPVVIVPTLAEAVFGTSIGSRTAALPTFKELGPPDLVHISKYNKHTHKEEGEYHFITGIDVSSPIAPIGYITTLNLNQTTSSLKHPSIFTYCTFNAFSKADVRIRVELPTKTPTPAQLQFIPSDRSRKISNQVSEQIWDEVYVSALVRCIIINEDFERKLPGLVEKSPFQSISTAKTLIAKLVEFLDRGFQLGASSTVQRPTNRENYLLDALYRIIELTDLYDYTIGLIEAKSDPYYDLIVSKLLFKNNEEIKGIKRLHNAMQANSRDSLLLNEQVDFLLIKNNIELAYEVALRSVRANPISFDTWCNLVKSQILKNDIAGALISLNSAPMYSERPKDLTVLNQADSKRLPYPVEGKVAFVWENDPFQVYGANSENLIKFSSKFEIQAVDPALLRINKQLLRGTYQKAYELLILIINKVGWDGLLKKRSEVFIMDEEYKKNVSTISLKSEKMLPESSFRTKRLCEKWLDDLFLVLYEDLRVVLIVANELSNQNQLKHSALEWELIGLTAYRAGHYKNSIASLRTSLSAKFDIISAMKLLKLWELNHFHRQFQMLNRFNQNGDVDLSLDQMLDVLLKSISYNIRFYNELQLGLLLLLKKIITSFDSEYIKNKIQIFFENDNNDYSNTGIIPPFDKLVALVQGLVQM